MVYILYLVISQQFSNQVLKVIKDAGYNENNVTVQIVATKQGPNALIEASRVPINVLILDVNTGPGLGPAVLRYRLSRPNVRIVLLAEKEYPGNVEFFFANERCWVGVF
ncbi:MAG: hypothetical protein AB1420_14890 [Bacillota bacterium]